MLLQEFEDKAWATSVDSRPSKAESKAFSAGRPALRTLLLNGGRFHDTAWKRQMGLRSLQRSVYQSLERHGGTPSTRSQQKSRETSSLPLLIDSGASEHMVLLAAMFYTARSVCHKNVLKNVAVVTQIQGRHTTSTRFFVHRQARTEFT